MSAESVRRCRELDRLARLRRAEARYQQSLGIVTPSPVDEHWAASQRKEREAAARLCAKHFRDPRNPEQLQLPTPIVLMYDYWMARACGWDVLSEAYSRDDAGEACTPGDSKTWRWWQDLHYRQRRWIRETIKEHLFARHKAAK